MSSPNAMTFPAGPDSVMINAINLPSGIIYKTRNLLRNVICWHKFIVSNTDGLARDEVLQAILDHVHPLDLIPVFYAKDPLNSNSYFLARNCEAAIEKLCKDNLTVDHPYNKKTNNRHFTPFKLSIILNFSNTNDIKIDVQKNVLQVLNKRFNVTTRTLNLDRFSDDPELGEFCPLSQPKIMYFVLHISKNLSPEEIILSNNGIKLLNPLDVLIGLKLKSLDLRNNELSSLNDISALKHFHLKVLYLDGNTLCECEEEEYINKVRLLCPTVEILDGIPLNIDKFPITKRNYFCDDTGHDLVNQFLEYFFTVYDSRDRKSLAGLYHSDAMFSLTCVYLANQLSSSTAFLKTYSFISRNLKRAADLSRTEECLFRGRDTIINVFENKLPCTEHDPFSLSADLIYKTERCAVIVVSGLFHEIPNSLLDKERLLGFTRTFALEILDRDAKCIITNEQLHVYNGLTCQERNSFHEPIIHNKFILREYLPKPQGKSDLAVLVTTLGEITSLKEEWAKKCLEECQYDLKKSLELFVDLYKGDKIPRIAFVEQISEKSNPEKSPYDPSKIDSKATEPELIISNMDLNNNPLGHLRSQVEIPANLPIDSSNILRNSQNNLLNMYKNVLPGLNQLSQNSNMGYEMVLAGQNGLEVYEPIFNVQNQQTKNKIKNKQLSSSNVQKKPRGPSVYKVVR